MDLSLFTISGEQERNKTLQLQNARLIRLRWFYLSILSAVAAVSNYIASHPEVGKRYIFIGVAGLAINSLFYITNKLIVRHKRTLLALMMLQLLLDLGVATLATYEQGGLDARTTALFALPIVAAGLIFTYSVVYITAVLAAAGYVLSLIYHNLNENQPLYLSDFLVPLIFYPVFFLIFARLVVHLMRVTTEDTQEKAYDAFLALLSHQLKHPVSTANAIIDQLENGKSGVNNKKYIEMLKSENQNLSLLLNNLIETAASPALMSKYDVVDLPALLQKISYESAEKYSRTADLKLELQDMSLKVKANHERIKTAIMNVLNNSFQYSEKGTPVWVSLEKAGGNAIITVEDKGGGLDEHFQEKFQKYNMGDVEKQGVQGLGLGLFVAKKIITAHKGALHIKSDKKGTKVIITLKRGDADE